VSLNQDNCKRVFRGDNPRALSLNQDNCKRVFRAINCRCAKGIPVERRGRKANGLKALRVYDSEVAGDRVFVTLRAVIPKYRLSHPNPLHLLPFAEVSLHPSAGYLKCEKRFFWLQH
jgi:hypothetical protein